MCNNINLGMAKTFFWPAMRFELGTPGLIEERKRCIFLNVISMILLCFFERRKLENILLKYFIFLNELQETTEPF